MRVGCSDSGRGPASISLAAALASAAATGSGGHPRAEAASAAVSAEAAARQPSGNVAPEAGDAGSEAGAAAGAAASKGHGTALRGTPPTLPVEISNEISAQTRADLYHTRCKLQPPSYVSCQPEAHLFQYGVEKT